ncbi:histidinol-phosphate transaminase [Chryseobacterium gossypii]|uniref:histidinol-phosphate transaminase n=1 Tax=Chryseobacterium gossypii TaxID=3231602 RepID=UPI003524BA3E
MKKTPDITHWVRENILKLQPYISFRDLNDFNQPVFMDANENPSGRFNRYPDSTQKLLKEKLAELKNISTGQVAIGNGSDELIDLIIKIFCEPKKDSVLVMNPSFAMYGFYASINENRVVKLDLDKNFDIVKNDFIRITKDVQLKVFFLCSPNNPTGNSIEDIEFYVRNFNGIVVVDEAYIEFSGRRSCLELLSGYPNLIVLQTFSKAWGMAGTRVGAAYASEEIIRLINTVKAPYNVNSISQTLILEKLERREEIEEHLKEISMQKNWLEKEFQDIDCITKVYPTEANFFLLEFDDVDKVYHELLKEEVLVSKRAPLIPGCIRVSIGNREDNNKLVRILKNIK